MNRRSFLSTISAIAAAPSLVRAEPPPIDKLTTAMNEIHRQQSAGPSFVGMTLEQLVEEIKGDHPFALRHAQQSKGSAVIEFDVMAPCSFTPPSWLNLGPAVPSYVFVGDILSFRVRVGPPFGPAALIQSSPL